MATWDVGFNQYGQADWPVTPVQHLGLRICRLSVAAGERLFCVLIFRTHRSHLGFRKENINCFTERLVVKVLPASPPTPCPGSCQARQFLLYHVMVCEEVLPTKLRAFRRLPSR